MAKRTSAKKARGRRAHAAKSSVVLDGSVAIAWLFYDEQNSYADSIAARVSELEFVVPSLWHLEVANVLLVGERRGRSTPADTAQWTAFLAQLPMSVDQETTNRAWSDVLTLARTHGLSAYDAAYLELASRRTLPLATLDESLRKAAGKCGVALFEYLDSPTGRQL